MTIKNTEIIIFIIKIEATKGGGMALFNGDSHRSGADANKSPCASHCMRLEETLFSYLTLILAFVPAAHNRNICTGSFQRVILVNICPFCITYLFCQAGYFILHPE